MQFLNVPEGKFHELYKTARWFMTTYFRFSNRFLLWFLFIFLCWYIDLNSTRLLKILCLVTLTKLIFICSFICNLKETFLLSAFKLKINKAIIREL